MKKLVLAVLMVGMMVALGGMSSPVAALPWTGTGTGVGGASLSVVADFTISGNLLTIILTNNSPAFTGQDVPGNTLTGVFFDLTGNPTLTPISATIVANSLVQAASCSIGPCNGTTTNVGGEFRYDTGAFPGSADRGVASAGYIGGAANMIGPNLDAPANGVVNGINFGILAPLDGDGYNPNGGLLGRPLIRNSATFVLSGVNGLALSDISHVSYQFGTALTEPNVPGTRIPPVPEPTTILLLGSGLAGLAVWGRRKRR